MKRKLVAIPIDTLAAFSDSKPMHAFVKQTLLDNGFDLDKQLVISHVYEKKVLVYTEQPRAVWWVYYNGGSCTYGDHDCDLYPFQSRKAALAFIAELGQEYRESARIIVGYEEAPAWTSEDAENSDRIRTLLSGLPGVLSPE